MTDAQDADVPTANERPLAGLKVLDLTTTFLGPYCTLLLSQMGAEVIKVEAPAGDVVRQVGPAQNEGMGSVHMIANAGKQSVVVDLRTSRGQELLDTLAKNADVLVHNMRPGAAERLRLTEERFSAVNEQLIVASASGYSANNPKWNRPVYDDIIQAESGIAYLQGLRHGAPNYVSTIIADKTCGLLLLAGILAAINGRRATGVARPVHVSMYEAMASFFLMEHMYGQTFEPPLGHAAYTRVTTSHRRPYRTADGYVAAMVYTNDQWAAFLTEIGRADLVSEHPFTTMTTRNENIDVVYAFLESHLVRERTAHWLEMFERIDCPATEVRSLEDLIEDQHLRDIGVVQEMDHPTQGRVRGLGLPLEFGTMRCRPTAGQAPDYAEHTRRVLMRHGLSSDDVDELAREGVVYTLEPEHD